MDYKKLIGFGGSLGVGLILAAAGLHYDAKALFYAGAILLAVVVAAWLFVWANPITRPGESEEAERRSRRRKIINEAREMVANHELQTRRDWNQTIRYSPEYAAVRPHLSRKYLTYAASGKEGRTIVAGAVHQHPVSGFLDELDRLEREWKLS